METKLINRKARAKINLTLHVTGQRSDGYHLLDSLVCFADIGDEISIESADDLELMVDGPLSHGVPSDHTNLMMKAAQLFRNDKGARMRLTKYLPNAAGIGGGSADAAATLLSLAELWDAPLPDDVVELGADVPVCLSPMALRMRGIGDELSPISPLPPLWAVLVNPGVALETPPVFRALKKKNNPAMTELGEFKSARDFANWCAAQRNDLQVPAMSEVPIIEDVLDALSPSLLARMSGSGATCFGLCESKEQADALAKETSVKHEDWWVVSTSLS